MRTCVGMLIRKVSQDPIIDLMCALSINVDSNSLFSVKAAVF